MRLNRPTDLYLISNDSDACDRSVWNDRLNDTLCHNTPDTLNENLAQIQKKINSLGWPKKLQDDSIAHYKSYTSRAELALILDNEKKRSVQRPTQPVKPPRKTINQSSKILNINQHDRVLDRNINNIKYPHNKVNSINNHNMTTSDPYQKSFYSKPKFEISDNYIQQQQLKRPSNLNFQYQLNNTLVDNFVKRAAIESDEIRDPVSEDQNLNSISNSNSISIESPATAVVSNRDLPNRNRDWTKTDIISSRGQLAETTGSDSISIESPATVAFSKRDLPNRNMDWTKTDNISSRGQLAETTGSDSISIESPATVAFSKRDLPNRNRDWIKTDSIISHGQLAETTDSNSIAIESPATGIVSSRDLPNRNRDWTKADILSSRGQLAEMTGTNTNNRVDNEAPVLATQKVISANRRGDCDAGSRIESYRAYLNAKKQEKTDINNSVKYCGGSSVRPQTASRRAAARKKRYSESLAGFDVYNIETALPQIDLDAIETHLRAAREEERRRRNDREEIRRRLATGDTDDFATSDRPGRKPSLQSRLQSGMNLQICFMNETMSDNESPSSDQDSPAKKASSNKMSPSSESADSPSKLSAAKPVRPLFNKKTEPVSESMMQDEADFFAQQAKLQAEARQGLAEAKDNARRQMEIERQRMTTSPITDMLRASLTKVGVPFPEERRRLSRQLLTNMNVAQLQVIVNDLHTQIEILNEDLVKMLMERDELHMGQDSMLVDIEDLTRYLGAKEKSLKDELRKNSNSDAIKALTPMMMKSKQTRISPLSLMKK